MFCKLNKYGEFNNYDLFKIFAFVLMVIDHIGFFFFPESMLLRAVGRLSFPIYAMLHGIITKNNTEHKANYLLLFLGLSTNLVFYILFKRFAALNILVSFFLFDFVFAKMLRFDYKSFFALFILVLINYFFYSTLNMYIEYGLFVLLFMLVGKIFYKVGTNIIENVFSFSVFLTYFLTQIKVFRFNNICSMICGVGLLILLVSMYDFKFREYHNVNSNRFLLFLSRYSLELYFIHLILFMFMFKLTFYY